MNKIIKNTDNGKYFTGRYRDGFWSRDIEDAYLFSDEGEIQKSIRKYQEDSGNPFEDIKIILIETVYKFN
jgi:hypothetical protein